MFVLKVKSRLVLFQQLAWNYGKLQPLRSDIFYYYWNFDHIFTRVGRKLWKVIQMKLYFLCFAQALWSYLAAQPPHAAPCWMPVGGLFTAQTNSQWRMAYLYLCQPVYRFHSPVFHKPALHKHWTEKKILEKKNKQFQTMRRWAVACARSEAGAKVIRGERREGGRGERGVLLSKLGNKQRLGADLNRIYLLVSPTWLTLLIYPAALLSQEQPC